MSACIKRKSDGQIISSCSGQSVSAPTDLQKLHEFVTSRGMNLSDYEFVDIDKAQIQELIEAQDNASRPYDKKRKRAYPTVGDQLDAMWKGGQEELDMKATIQKVKSDYPKP